MLRILFLVLPVCFVSACNNCNGLNCRFEASFNPGRNFITEDRASKDIKFLFGALDSFSSSPNRHQIEANYFEVETHGFQGFEAIQRREDWCWAAAVSMAMDYQGISLDQCDVLRSLGKDCNSPEPQFGSRNSIINALSGLRLNNIGRPAAISATTLATGNGTTLIEDVATNWPPIVGLGARRDQPGHVYVLTSIRYSWHPGTWNVPVIWKVRLYDPWDGEYVVMSGSEFDDVFDFAVRIRVQHG